MPFLHEEIFYFRIIFHSKNGGVCKKQESNILNIDPALAIYSLKNLGFISLRKVVVNSEFFDLHDHWCMGLGCLDFHLPCYIMKIHKSKNYFCWFSFFSGYSYAGYLKSLYPVTMPDSIYMREMIVTLFGSEDSEITLKG